MTLASVTSLAPPQEEGRVLGETLQAPAVWWQRWMMLEHRQASAVWWQSGLLQPRTVQPSCPPPLSLPLTLFLPSVYVTFLLTLEHICPVLKEESELRIGDVRV